MIKQPIAGSVKGVADTVARIMQILRNREDCTLTRLAV